jgi:urease accessory protein UreF
VTDAATLERWTREVVRFGVAPLDGQAVVRAARLSRRYLAAGDGAETLHLSGTPPAAGAVETDRACRIEAQAAAQAGTGAPRLNGTLPATAGADAAAGTDRATAAATAAAREVARLSDTVASFLPSREARAAGAQLGRSLLTAALQAFPELAANPCYAAVRAAGRGRPERLQLPVAWGVAGGLLGLGPVELLQAYLLAVVRQWSQVAVRLVPLGQAAALGVLGALLDEVTALAASVAQRPRPPASAAPGWDLSMLGHGELPARYFRS